jgi:predicted membrane channel-forming protein YqfA (hemolysin III family)
MTTKEDTAKTINNIQLILIIILLTLVVWLVTINVDFDIFIILMIISIIALKEMLEKFLSLRLQKRMNILFYLLFIPLVIIFVQRIINILSMYPS